jgi:hypothetical protein
MRKFADRNRPAAVLTDGFKGWQVHGLTGNQCAVTARALASMMEERGRSQAIIQSRASENLSGLRAQ